MLGKCLACYFSSFLFNFLSLSSYVIMLQCPPCRPDALENPGPISNYQQIRDMPALKFFDTFKILMCQLTQP
ncbi:hypothetical protein F4804DRAFT_325716 [Jackrogersella minutella]|nr:hypothetical protein F4804DRAFT_325716 [Jackrogersella minutella]